MINADFTALLSSMHQIERLHMAERDVILHQILTDLAGDKFFFKNFLFKGGTCLIKHHLGYFRFSDDIDFTWKDQSKFKDKSAKAIRRELSLTISTLGKILEQISSARKLDFKYSKGDANYVELGGSNKTCTFKLWYHSAVLPKKLFIKVQINFVEKMCAEPEQGLLSGLTIRENGDLKALFPEYLEYSRAIPFHIYSASEILSEKIRALITRKGIKTRDFFDVFFIQKELNIRPADVESCVIKKTNHALGLYSKYRANLKAKAKLIEKGAIYEPDEESDLLLAEINEKEFQKFVKELTAYLQKLIKKLGASRSIFGQDSEVAD